MFSDVGSLGGIYPDSTLIQDTGGLRASVGLGISWVSPFGPITVDYGIPVLKENFDKTEAFRINFGTRF